MSNLLEQASLVMIPSGYKEDVVYSQIPLDGSGDLQLTRASNGTRINSAGLVEVVPWNLQTYSEDFSNASWSKNNSPVMAYNVATAPNGTMTADSIQSNNASVYQAVAAQTQSVAPNSTVTLSIYIKKETSKTYFTGSYLYFTGGTTKLTYVLFDEVNGTINIIAPDEVSMVTSVESVGDWWRFIITGTDTGGNTNLDYAFYGTLSQNGTTLNPGIGSARTIWGAQLNMGSTAKPYFPTTDRLNVPRLTYQNGGGGCPSLLLEKQSTNLNIYSEDYTNATWDKLDIVTTNYSNVVISPDGTQNASKLIPNTTSSSYHGLQLSSGRPSLTGGVVYTYSLYAKAQGYTKIRLQNFSQGVRAQFDLSNGTLINENGTTSTFIDSMGNGWYRIGFTYTQSITQSSYWNILVVSTNDNTGTAPVAFSGNGTDSIAIYGAQIEASSYPTSYIPTTSSSATRVADECFKTGISSLIGQTEGVIFVDFYYNLANNTPNGSDKGIMTIRPNGGSYSNEIALLYYGDEGGSYGKTIQVTVSVGGAVQCSLKTPQTLTNGYYKVAFAYKQNDFAFYVNGTQIGTDTSGSVPTCDELYLIDPLRINPNTTIKEAILFPTRLTNAELASLTTL